MTQSSTRHLSVCMAAAPEGWLLLCLKAESWCQRQNRVSMLQRPNGAGPNGPLYQSWVWRRCQRSQPLLPELYPGRSTSVDSEHGGGLSSQSRTAAVCGLPQTRAVRVPLAELLSLCSTLLLFEMDRDLSWSLKLHRAPPQNIWEVSPGVGP